MSTTSSAALTASVVKYDPATTATSLASAYTSGLQTLLTAQTKAAASKGTALASLKSAMASYQASLTALTGSKKTILSKAATLSDTNIGTATATASASAGAYSFFVEQLAKAHQVKSDDLTSVAVASGDTMSISVGTGTAVTINLNETASSVNLTAKDIAAAINNKAESAALVTASVMTVNGVAKLMLTSKVTGEAGAIGLSSTNSTLNDALTTTATTLAPAQDAVIYIGNGSDSNGTAIKANVNTTKIQQSSNTFTNIGDVSMTFTKAQALTDAPITLTVATDSTTTTANAQSFVTAYNTLKGVLDGLVYAGNPSKSLAAGAMANDAGVSVLRNQMVSTLRDKDAVSGLSLANYGITSARDGTLTLDSGKLTSALALNPDALDTIIGSNATGVSSGVAGKLDKYMKIWSNSSNGQLTQRQTAIDKLQTSLTTRQSKLDDQYNNAYKRYLLQFTQLQTVQAQMSTTGNILDALP